jgi:hypothetical protein
VVCNVPGRGYLKVGEDQMLQIINLAHDPALQRLGVAQSSDGCVLLTIRIEIPDGDPVVKIAPVIAALLSKLDQVRGP